MSDHYGIDAALQRIQENQFRKGKSGNPAGRPKGTRNMKTIVQELANEQHTFRENGTVKKLSVAELLLKIRYCAWPRAVGGEKDITCATQILTAVV